MSKKISDDSYSTMNSILQMFVFMLLVTSFSNCQSFSWPLWIQNESCYERIIICERYDRNNPTCSNQAGHLGSNGFRIIDGRNEFEIEGRSALFQSDGGLIIRGSVWKTTIGSTERTSVLTTSHNIDLIDCPSTFTTILTYAYTTTVKYNFHCGNDTEVIEPAQTGIIYFKDLGICGNNSQNVILVAVRQGINSYNNNIITIQSHNYILTLLFFSSYPCIIRFNDIVWPAQPF